MEKIDYEKIVKLSATELRSLCIQERYYTSGCCADYEHMFELAVKENISDHDIQLIAEDIKRHSKTDDSVAVIMTRILNVCYFYYM
ncbi:MAG: hypothetical protein PHR92_08360, partial [Lachnospiraceae bacterium]|nr:hypothetical protein [Lachnospiraceae bacterium]